jgi:glutamate racemase
LRDPSSAASAIELEASRASHGTRPVGVFDSGVGGLAVLFELQKLMPAESFVYFADTLNCPWGSRGDAEILEFATQASQTLIDAGSKLIVVACNSATTVALPVLRERFAVPFVGTEPAVKPAAALTRSGRIGVMATPATVRSGSLQRLAERHASGIDVQLFPCPDRLVQLVEKVVLSGPEVEQTLRPVIDEIRLGGLDVLVLGCTHYSFLRGAIESMLGPAVTLLDTGVPVARQAQRVLESEDPLAPGDQLSTVCYLASSESAEVALIASALGASISSV